MKSFIVLLLLLSAPTQATTIMNLDKYKVDKSEKNKEFNIEMSSGKFESERFFKGHRFEEIAAPTSLVLKSVLNFKNRCNNELADKRKSVAKDFKCQFLSKSLIETIDIKELLPYKALKNEVSRRIVTRRVYNREHFQYHELIIVYKVKDTYFVTTKMLTNDEAKKHIAKPIDKESVLTNIETLYKIEKTGKNKSQLTYTYLTTTDHWLLNKSVAVSQFFDGMANSISRFFKAISTETKSMLVAQVEK